MTLVILCYNYHMRMSCIRRHRTIGIKQSAQVIVKEETLRIKGSSNAAEIVPARIESCQPCCILGMHLSPMWASVIKLQNLLNMLEIGFVLHPLEHMHSDIGRLALIGRTEPDVIGMDKTTPSGK